MTEAVIVAPIAGGVSLAGSVLAARASAKKTDAAIQVNQAVMETKLDDLTREVREHNDFARRVPVLEEQVKVINHRIKDLEGYHR